MNNYLILGCLAVSMFFTISGKAQESPYDFVDPFIGTDFHGHTYPGAILPFGAVQLSPDTRLENWDAASGYHYSDSTMLGFSHTHLSGTGVVDLGDILIHPTIKEPRIDTTGKYIFQPIAFDHKDEIAKPGYYRVHFKDSEITSELTATKRVGVHRYTFPNTEQAHLIIDLAHNLAGEKIDSLKIVEVGPNIIKGYRVTSGWTPNQHIYFVAHFSKPFTKVTLVQNREVVENGNAIKGKDLQAVCTFNTTDVNSITLKVGTSIVSTENAMENLKAEALSFNFDEIRKAARKDWVEALNQITVAGGTPSQKSIFYTALYHTLLTPNIISDVNGDYRSNNMTTKNTGAGKNMYSTLSLWDTFRTWHPLMTLLDDKLVNDIIFSMLSMYEDTGELPIWPLSTGETGTMIGYHSVSVISDAYQKGIRGYDAKKALEAMKVSSRAPRKGKKDYLERGFIPANSNKESVSALLEYAYDDWAIAQLAKEEDDKYQDFSSRAQSFVNVYDGKTRFFRGKRSDGNWIQGFDPLEVSREYTEANAWQYRFFVPHDMNGLINLLGGTENFVSTLDSLFTTTSDFKGELQDITGLIGQYAHGNEPSHHVAYLYNYAGQPWKSQRRIREILEKMYSAEPDGIVGNEDAGQMSAWYIMSSMGIYPVTPGTGEYVFTSPVFPKIELSLYNGKKLKILANDPMENPYIDKVTWNDEEITTNFITHAQLMQGGTLHFYLSDTPNFERGTAKAALPYSQSSGKKVSIPYVNEDVYLFEDEVYVSLGSATSEASIFYTLDGSDPNKHSQPYQGKIQITGNLIIKAKGYKEGYSPSEVLEIPAQKAKYQEAVNLEKPKNGVRYTYFEGNFKEVKDIEKIQEAASGTIDNFDITRAQKEDKFGFRFQGYIYAPETGVYTFYTSSDDGSVLTIGENEVVNNDFSHGKITATGKIALQEGYHPYTLYYFEDYEGQFLEMGWQTPNSTHLEKISSKSLFLP